MKVLEVLSTPSLNCNNTTYIKLFVIEKNETIQI